MNESHEKISRVWLGYKEDPERPLTAILTLNTFAHTVGALGVGYEVEKLNPGRVWCRYRFRCTDNCYTIAQ